MSTGGCGCGEEVPTMARQRDIFDDNTVELYLADARESDASNYLTAIHPPVIRNAFGGPNEAPSPRGGVNDNIMIVLEAKSFDLMPFYFVGISDAAESITIDEAANFLDEGYIGGEFQTA